jgi:hypothetical protein
VFFIFHLQSSGEERCGSDHLLYYNSKACAILPAAGITCSGHPRRRNLPPGFRRACVAPPRVDVRLLPCAVAPSIRLICAAIKV